ncbi:MAG: hypothetical protein R2787_15055 [Saprospiraceae bacterium]
MRHILLSLLMIGIWQTGFSQIDIQVSTLDSFATTATGQNGVYALDAAASGSMIHLSYYYSDSTSRTWLLYSTRSQTSLSTDTITEIQGYTKSLSGTAIQIDSMGNPWVYAGFNSNNTRYIKAYHRVNDTWVESFSLNQLGTPHQWVAAAPNAREIGFVYPGIRIPPTNQYPIHYARFNGTSWEQSIISDVDKSEKTRPSVVSTDSSLYVAFAESRCPDTLITRVYARTDSGWIQSFEDVWTGEYDCSGLEERSTKLGADQEGVYLLQDMHLDESFPQLFRFDGATWKQGDVFFDEDWVHPFFMSSTVQVDDQQTLYWINQEKSDQPGLCLVRTDGECGYVALPHDQYAIALQDMVILDGYAYVYYYEGNYNWPWGKPVTFKEARISIDQIVPIQPSPSQSAVSLLQHAPNPFSGESTITCTIARSCDASLAIHDLLGRPVANLFDGRLEPGQYAWEVNGQHLTEGMYICVLRTPDQQMTTTMLVVH